MRKTALAVAFAVFLAPAAALPQTKSGKSGVYEQLNLFGEAFERIRHDAVEAVGDSKLVQTAITGMLAGLDPHSVYLSENEYKALQTRTPDESASTGLVVTLDNGQVKVVAPREGAPLGDQVHQDGGGEGDRDQREAEVAEHVGAPAAEQGEDGQVSERERDGDGEAVRARAAGGGASEA